MNCYVYSKNSSKFNNKVNNHIIEELKAIFDDLEVLEYDSFISIDISKVHYLIVSGGDGIIHNVVNYCKNRLDSIIFGFIPTGTANDFCHNNNIKNIDQAIEIIKSKEIKNISLINVNETLATYALSVGEMSNVSIKSKENGKKFFHKFIYKIQGIKYLFVKKEKVCIFIDDIKKECKVKALMIVRTKYLGGMKISKEIYDDKINMLLIRNIFDIIKIFIFGRFKKKKKKEINNVIIESDALWCLDGEEYNKKKAEISINKNKIRLLSKNT